MPFATYGQANQENIGLANLATKELHADKHYSDYTCCLSLTLQISAASKSQQHCYSDFWEYYEMENYTFEVFL